MNRVSSLTSPHAAVAIVFLCMMALTLCQVLGPTARLNHTFSPADFSERAFAAAPIHSSGSHSALPSRCASIKLAPIEIRIADFERIGAACAPFFMLASTPPISAELGVPTPPPRWA